MEFASALLVTAAGVILSPWVWMHTEETTRIGRPAYIAVTFQLQVRCNVLFINGFTSSKVTNLRLPLRSLRKHTESNYISPQSKVSLYKGKIPAKRARAHPHGQFSRTHSPCTCARTHGQYIPLHIQTHAQYACTRPVEK